MYILLGGDKYRDKQTRRYYKKSSLKAANMNNWIIPERLKTANKGLIDFVAGHYIQ